MHEFHIMGLIVTIMITITFGYLIPKKIDDLLNSIREGIKVEQRQDVHVCSYCFYDEYGNKVCFTNYCEFV